MLFNDESHLFRSMYVYYESITYTGLVVELEHLKIKTRLTNEKFASVKGQRLFIITEKARSKDRK